MKSTKQVFNLDDWITSISKTMALELIKLIDTQKEDRGPEVAKAVTARFLAAFVAATVVRSLDDPKHPNSKENYKIASDNFMSHKIAIQDAVAAGFTGAVNQVTGKDLEYYCQVKVVPEVVNKSLN